MNKSKFLKKSLAAVLAVLMVVAMIPLSAAAAAPTFSGASVTTDVSSTETILNVSGNTIEGNISLAAKSFTLYLLPGNDVTDNVSVSYEDLRKSDRPEKGDAQVIGERWVIGDPDTTGRITFTTNDFLSDDENTITMKVTAVNDLNKNETTEYTVILHRVPDPSDTTISSLHVWTYGGQVSMGSSGRVPQGWEKQRIPQLGETKINNDYNTIDITVPFNTEAVWVRDFEMADGATAEIGHFVEDGTPSTGKTLGLYNDSVVIQGGINTKWANAAAWHNDEKGNPVGPNVLLVPIKVTAGGFSRNYTLRLTRSQGIESFKFENAIDSKVFPNEGVIAVVMPFGYTNDNYKDNSNPDDKAINAGDTLTVKPVFDLEYAGTEVPTLTWVDNDKDVPTPGTSKKSSTLESGKTEIKLAADLISLNNYDYKNGPRLADATSFSTWASAHTSGQAFTAQSANAISNTLNANPDKRYLEVKYVEGTTRKYNVVVLEAKENYEALIKNFEYGNEEATIDQDAQTIDITLPTGTDLTKLRLSGIKIFASDAASISLPLYSNIKFLENGDSNIYDVAQPGGTPVTNPENWGDPDFWNKKQVDHVQAGDHGSTNLVRSELNLYRAEERSEDELHGNIPNIVVRVVSQDKSTTRDYKLNFSVNTKYEKPKVTNITLKKGDAEFEGVLNESTGIYTIEVPYSYQTTESLEGFQLFYGKTAGSSIIAANWGKQSGFRLTGKESFLNSDMDDEDSLYTIRDAIGLIRRTRKHAYDYDYILFDLPPHLGELSVAVLAASDHVLVPATVDSYSMNGYGELMDTVDSIQNMGLNPDLDIIGVFFTMIQPLQKYDRSMYQDVREQLGNVFIDTPIRSNSNAKLAAHIGCPLCWLKRSAGVTQDYIAVTEEVLRRCGVLKEGEHLPNLTDGTGEDLSERLMK